MLYRASGVIWPSKMGGNKGEGRDKWKKDQIGLDEEAKTGVESEEVWGRGKCDIRCNKKTRSWEDLINPYEGN